MDQPIQLQEPIEEFLRTVEEESRKKQNKKQPLESDSQEEVGQVAFWYEKIRMAIDYREEHLLRRTASRRILKRLFLIEGRKKEIADLLLKELIMGGYVKKSDLSQEKFTKINQVLEKYAFALSLKHSTILTAPDIGKETKRWLVTLASFEIEEILYPEPERRALINAVYKLLAPRIDTGSRRITEKQKNLQTHIAIYRSLAKADRAMVVSEVFRIYFPDWFENPSIQRIKAIVANASQITKITHNQATNMLASRIFYSIKKQTLFAYILYEIIMASPADARGIIAQQYILREFIKDKMNEEYLRTEKKLKKRITRGIIYVFLTKMLLAILIEIPYETYFVGHFNYTALAINILFPPLFMFFLANSARVPGNDNTEAVIDGINKLIYDDPQKDEIKKIRVFPSYVSGLPQKALDLVYFFSFSLVFGFFIALLYFFKFDFVSGAIFIIFMGTVSFFGALIRQSVRDLIVIKEKEGIGSLIFDTLLLPSVRFGRFLSTNFSRVNVFMFLLDVIIEAPFKMVIRLFESWVNFLKRKREEVDQQFG
ncbi:MAG: hypothetical protein ABIC19_02845 [Patescibacteria group bacterium]|nr:hypothetical protein [Patescibacteria group bacterium]